MKNLFKALMVFTGVVLLNSTVFAQSGMLQIKGSDTLINLVQRLAEVYMQQNPGASIAVTGGGSGTGIAALINKKTDIADASRLMKDKEITQANSMGVNPKRVVIAMDGVSVIINTANRVDKLTVDQCGKIFRGEITNWREVGGSDMPITLYGRQSNSGTYVYFMEEVLKGDYSPQMNQMNGNSQIVEGVKSDASGIGYVGVGYAKEATGITVVKIAEKAGEEFSSPLNDEAISSGKYPLVRPLNQYLNGTPTGLTKKFIQFEIGPAGQKIVEELGFFPIPGKYVEFNKNSVGF